MSTTIPKRVKRTNVLSTKVTERDSSFLQAMVNRYFEHGIIPQAKTSTLLRVIVRDFLRKRCPGYEQNTTSSYQHEISKLYSEPSRNNRFPQPYQLQKTSYTPEPSMTNTTL